jgi:hypothetical protein
MKVTSVFDYLTLTCIRGPSTVHFCPFPFNSYTAFPVLSLVLSLGRIFGRNLREFAIKPMYATVRRSRISHFSEGRAPDPISRGKGMGGERRGKERRGKEIIAAPRTNCCRSLWQFTVNVANG